MKVTHVQIAERMYIDAAYLIAEIEPERGQGEPTSERASQDLASLRTLQAMLHRRYDHVSVLIGGKDAKKAKK